MKIQFILVFMLLASLSNAQTGKKPVSTGQKTNPTAAVKPSKNEVSIEPLGVAQVGLNRRKNIYVTKPLSRAAYSYSSDNGRVDISYERSKTAKDDVKTTTSTASAAMCLTKEEIRGQKIENEQIIADGSIATLILPGAVIDAELLLKSGEFKYIKMNDRKKISLSTTSNLAKKHSNEVVPGNNNNNIEEELRSKVFELTKPSNLSGMPNMKSVSEGTMSTLSEKTGLNIGASFFYLGVSVDNNFKFSSNKFHYMYLYEFEQECLPVIANAVSSPADLFKETVSNNDNWLYIREVKYGRRLYVLVESEYDLEKYADELNGDLSWGVVSSKISVDVKHSSLSRQTNIKIITQGGSPVNITDRTKLQQTLDDYFKTPFKSMDIVPLSYKLTYMDGSPVSMISNAFLDGKNCLDADKLKIRITKVECKKVDDSKKNEEVYGSASIFLYNSAGKPLAPDGKTVWTGPISMPVGSFSFGTKDAPIVLGPGKSKEYEVDQQGKYSVLGLPNLDLIIEIKPSLHEKDNVFNKDDDFITEDRMKKTLRLILTENSTTPEFEFRHKNSIIKLYFEIIPE